SRDLTELARSRQQLAEQLAALQASEAMSGAILASTSDSIVVIDEGTRVVAFNPAAERTFGHMQAEAVGRPIAELIAPPTLRKRYGDNFRRYVASGHSKLLGHRVEIEGMRADGTVIPLELTLTTVHLPARRLFTAYLRDLTEIKATAAEIERQRDALHDSE